MKDYNLWYRLLLECHYIHLFQRVKDNNIMTIIVDYQQKKELDLFDKIEHFQHEQF